MSRQVVVQSISVLGLPWQSATIQVPETTEVCSCRAPWLTPVIPATEEAEIRRIEVLSQPRQIVPETLPCLKNPSHKVLVEWLKL
jgi:hypothetical protein